MFFIFFNWINRVTGSENSKKMSVIFGGVSEWMASDRGSAEPWVGSLRDPSPWASHHAFQEASQLSTAAGKPGPTTHSRQVNNFQYTQFSLFILKGRKQKRVSDLEKKKGGWGGLRWCSSVLGFLLSSFGVEVEDCWWLCYYSDTLGFCFCLLLITVAVDFVLFST